MPNKRTKTKKKKKTSDLWITPRYSLKGPAGERAWENRPGGAPSTSRYLELADIALGIHPSNTKKQKTTKLTHLTQKREPYSNK